LVFFLFSLFQSNYFSTVSMTVIGIIVFAVIVVVIARRRNMKLRERTENALCMEWNDTKWCGSCKNEHYTCYILDSRTSLSGTQDKLFLSMIQCKHLSVCNIFYHSRFSFSRLFGSKIIDPFDFVNSSIPSILLIHQSLLFC
jgi:hypothetical protein